MSDFTGVPNWKKREEIRQKYPSYKPEELNGITVKKLIEILETFHPEERVTFGLDKKDDALSEWIKLMRISVVMHDIHLSFSLLSDVRADRIKKEQE